MKKRHNFNEDKELLSALNNISEALKNVVEAANKIATTISESFSPMYETIEVNDTVVPKEKDIQNKDLYKVGVVKNDKNVAVNFDPLASQVQRNKEFREGGYIPRATD